MHPYNYITYDNSWKSLLSISYTIEKLQHIDLNIPSDITIRLQRPTSLEHFRINVNNYTSALVRFSVQEFHGYTDRCRYGGIYMYRKIHYVMEDSGQLNLYPRQMKNDNTQEKRISYERACTTETSALPGSLVKELYLEFGSTHIIFYSFLSMFAIDIQMKVLLTPCVAMTDVYIQYCEDFLQPNVITTPHYNIMCSQSAVSESNVHLFLKSKRCFIIQNFHIVTSNLRVTIMYINWLGERDMNLSLTTDNITAISHDRLSERCMHSLYLGIFSNLRVESYIHRQDMGANSVTTNLTNQVREVYVNEPRTCLLVMMRSVLFVGETLTSQVACTSGTVQWVDNTMMDNYDFVSRSLCARLHVSFPYPRVIFTIVTEFRYDMPSAYDLTYFYIVPNRDCFLADGFKLRAFIISGYPRRWLVTQMNVRMPAMVFSDIGMFRAVGLYTIPLTVGADANTTVVTHNQTSCKLYLEEEHHQVTPWMKIVDNYTKNNEKEEFKVYLKFVFLKFWKRTC